MKLIKLNKRFIAVPDQWNELTGSQLVQVMNILFIERFTDDQKVFQLQRILFSMSRRKYRQLPSTEIDEYLYLVTFLMQGKIELTKNSLPKYRHISVFGSWDDFYGPTDECMNLIGLELVFAESFMMSWFDSKSDQDLNKLVSTLYRLPKKGYDHKRNPDGDVREQFNENICFYNADRYIRYWPKSVKLAILFWFRGCWQKWVDDNPDVFKGGGDPAKYGMISVLRNVAKDGIYGDFDKVGKTYVNQLLIELNETVAEAERIKAATKAL